MVRAFHLGDLQQIPLSVLSNRHPHPPTPYVFRAWWTPSGARKFVAVLGWGMLLSRMVLSWKADSYRRGRSIARYPFVAGPLLPLPHPTPGGDRRGVYRAKQKHVTYLGMRGSLLCCIMLMPNDVPNDYFESW